MLRLENNCRCSDLKVYPSNWKTSRASIRKAWYIWYRFYDPLFKETHPKGKLIIIKGMNEYTDLADRQDATVILLKNEMDSLEVLDYNPITGKMKEPILENAVKPIITFDTPIAEALRLAEQNRTCSNDEHINLRSILRYFIPALAQLRVENTPVKEFKRAYIKQALELVGSAKKEKWTANNYNFYRAYLSILFNELIEWDAIEYNPIEKLSKRKEIKKIRAVLTLQERKAIDEDLQKKNYFFWRFMQIFFHSGARTTEIMRVKYEDVDLQRQEVKYLVKKGKLEREVIRVIKDNVLHLWEEVMREAKPGDYLFTAHSKPSAVPINAKQICRKWQRWVKNKTWTIDGKEVKITVDFYPLKHLNSTQTRKKVGATLAAKHNEHSERIFTQVYDTEIVQDELDILKKVNNSFA